MWIEWSVFHRVRFMVLTCVSTHRAVASGDDPEGCHQLGSAQPDRMPMEATPLGDERVV
jgi:hypothetical protein